MSNGVASGENKAEDAVKKALDSPLLNDNKITGAKNVLLLIRSGSEEVTMDEIGVIMDHIQKEAGNTADIIFGVGTDEELGDSVSVLVIATGFAKDHQKHAGTAEKIKFSLTDSMDAPKGSPFKSKTEKEEITREDFTRKSLFILDDEDDFKTPEFKTTSVERQAILEKEMPTEIKYFDLEEEENIGQTFHIEEEEEEPNLFSFDSNESEIAKNTFSFEREEPLVERSEEKITNFSEEKPMEFSFFVNEPIEEPKVETPQPKAEIKLQPVQKTEQKVVEEIVETNDELTKFEVEDDFTFITKPTSNDKIVERRNKLKEFNSRYQVSDSENDFENVPAFKRKNIVLEGQNASEQTIHNFLSESNGSMQIRENRFLNKDVD